MTDIDFNKLMQTLSQMNPEELQSKMNEASKILNSNNSNEILSKLNNSINNNNNTNKYNKNNY